LVTDTADCVESVSKLLSQHICSLCETTLLSTKSPRRRAQTDPHDPHLVRPTKRRTTSRPILPSTYPWRTRLPPGLSSARHAYVPAKESTFARLAGTASELMIPPTKGFGLGDHATRHILGAGSVQAWESEIRARNVVGATIVSARARVVSAGWRSIVPTAL
jgi:hypothetical protein